MFLKQVIVVEGKTDVQKIKQAFPGDELEFLITNGLGFDETFLEVCKKTNAARGIIVMTDPDGPGNKIRARINEYLDFKCANAFVDKKNIKNTRKIGIAEAELADIVFALENAITFNGDQNPSLSWDDYLQHEFNLAANRKKIAAYFAWSEKINAKTLFKWLNYTGLTVEAVLEILRESNAS